MANSAKIEDPLTLYGGSQAWSSKDWTASDDRVRGGKSQSYLDCSNQKIGRFYGTLDIRALGGAGFASQRTTGDDHTWNLAEYAGIQLDIAKGDKKRYTFTLKDELLPPSDDGREQSSISWEIDFELPPQTKPGDTYDRTVFVPWKSLNPTYRGKLKKDAKPLDLKNIKRLSIMMRSFFGTQEGDFSLSIKSIAALKKTPTADNSESFIVDDRKLEDGLTGARAEDGFTGPARPSLAVKCIMASAISFLICYNLARWLLR